MSVDILGQNVKYTHIRQGRRFEKNPTRSTGRGSDIFTTMEPYFGGLKFLCDIFYYMTLNICLKTL